VELIELNEMSAAECLAVLREWHAWGVAPEALVERVNPAGGALATGNPWGATGAVLLARAVHALHRRNARIAMVALGAEGGQGMVLVLRNPG
jgi:acetyl-CoA C-acetyltransferase